ALQVNTWGIPTNACPPTLPAPYSFQVSCVPGNPCSVRRSRSQDTPFEAAKGNPGEQLWRLENVAFTGHPQNGPEQPFPAITFNADATANRLFVLSAQSVTLFASSVQIPNHS